MRHLNYDYKKSDGQRTERPHPQKLTVNVSTVMNCFSTPLPVRCGFSAIIVISGHMFCAATRLNPMTDSFVNFVHPTKSFVESKLSVLAETFYLFCHLYAIFYSTIECIFTFLAMFSGSI